MADLYDTHEQAERVKSWLRENGSAIVMGLALAFGLMFATRQFQSWQTSKRQQASAEYQVLSSLIGENKIDAAVSNYEVLKSDYPRSAYTAMAAMQMARARLQSGQSDLAVKDLTFAMDNAEPEPVKIIARERLARVKLSQGNADGALALLEAAPMKTGFEAQFAEILGDIHLAKGEKDLAIQSYRESLDNLEDGVGNREFLTMKLESLGATVDADGGDM